MKIALVLLQDMTDEVLLTRLVKLGDELVNSHPLTYTGLVPEASEALTPKHHVKRAKYAMFRRRYNGEVLRELYNRSQALADRLSKRWITEFVSAIKRRTR